MTISEKVRILCDEGYPQKQAVAIAYSMARAGKLGRKAKREASRRKSSVKISRIRKH